MILTHEQRSKLSERLVKLRDMGGKKAVARKCGLSVNSIYNLLIPDRPVLLYTYTKVLEAVKELEEEKAKLLIEA